MSQSSDTELEAIEKLISALGPLDQDARTRVIDYVFRRLRMGARAAGHNLDILSGPSDTAGAAVAATQSASTITDIRSLKEAKAPQTANEMAAIAAYYLADLAPLNDRKSEIKASDIKKLFGQAVFPMRGSPPTMILVNAKNAGYLDSAGTRGTYRLNPVGYNLVVHKLPASTTRPSNVGAGKARRKKRARKKTRSRK
jgi:hypothetical protein